MAEHPAPLRILFDGTHGQFFGNADWVITGAYSRLASDYRQYFSARVASTDQCSPSGKLTGAILDSYDVLVIPEPNERFTREEISAIHEFVRKGGGVFLIADHGGSDRNMDGYDSSLIFNELTEGWGLVFAGNTWSEAPVSVRCENDTGILQGVRAVGAWAATSLFIEQGAGAFAPILKPAHAPGAYLVAGRVSRGKVVAMGDSSPFDDGTGDTSKNRHNSYLSWLYSHPRLAVNIMAWLAERKAPAIHLPQPPFPLWKSAPRKLKAPVMVLDAAHGNTDADQLDRFAREMHKKLGFSIFINLAPLESLDRCTILFMSNPTLKPAPAEMQALENWIRNGGSLILTTYNAKNLLSAIAPANELLAALHSNIRFNADEIQDPVHNTGKPWSVVVEDFPALRGVGKNTRAVFWGACSLVTPGGQPLRRTENISLIAVTARTAHSYVREYFRVGGGHRLPDRQPLPVAAVEKIGEGHIAVLGANPFSNYQYPRKNDHVYKNKGEHSTKIFNLAVVKRLMRE